MVGEVLTLPPCHKEKKTEDVKLSRLCVCGMIMIMIHQRNILKAL